MIVKRKSCLLNSASIMLVCLAVSGCGRRAVIQKEVLSNEGNDRLLLIDDEWKMADGDTAHDFNSLVWQEKVKGRWRDVRDITCAHFANNPPLRRWVEDIHSFDPKSKTAIIMVAEERVSNNTPGVILCIRSWRKWDLTSNSEIAVLKDDVLVDEPFLGPE